MAYSSTNPPVPAFGVLTRASTDANVWPAPQLWLYRSTDRSSDIDDSGYFSDGHSLGMRVGDALLATLVTSHGSTTLAIIAAVVSALTTAGGATVIPSTLVSST